MSALVADLLALVDQLQQYDTTQLRLGVSAFILLAVAAAVASVRFLRPKLRGRFHSRVADAVLSVSIAVVGFAAVVSLLVLWGVGDDAAHALEQISGVADTGARAILALVVAAAAYVTSGFIKRAVDRFTDSHDTITEHQSEIAFRVLQLTVYVTAGAIIIGTVWKIDLSGLLVGAGFLGIIVGMAARQTLGSLLAGFVLMFSRPFEIGDWVKINDEEGIVTDISIVNTRIQTFDGEYVMIPNDIVSGEKIINKSRKGRLRIEVEVGVDYASDVERAADLAKDAMKGLDEILSVPTPQVVVQRFGDSAVVLGLRFWIDKPSSRRQWRARTAVIKAVKETFDREGVKIPYPQRELTGREESGGFRLAGEETTAVEATPDGGADQSDRPEPSDDGVGEE
ncbi:mechanosensitive ion channel family protein [Halorussus salilacus]|uniref:mechanosensitive ion channel family protein n=1 Tax=Halorussus salilacus TaxID=2953750 RepID=UPI00209DFBE1|nr:mechanosensitive ion channel family protein [Halorussus salilacus]USZ67964.1 mechanosensitive ion channel family protein [Halorussus salilacus]